MNTNVYVFVVLLAIKSFSYASVHPFKDDLEEVNFERDHNHHDLIDSPEIIAPMKDHSHDHLKLHKLHKQALKHPHNRHLVLDHPIHVIMEHELKEDRKQRSATKKITVKPKSMPKQPAIVKKFDADADNNTKECCTPS